MNSALGAALAGRRRVRWASIGVGCLAVGCDFLLVRSGLAHLALPRLLVAGSAAALLLILLRGDRHSVGLRWVPVQGWRPWVRITAKLAAVALLLVALATAVLWWMGRLIEPPRIAPADVPHRFWWSCVETPLFEEGIYRVAICVPLVVATRNWPAIVVSGVVFGLLHVAYGNAAPDNLVAGYLLAWAFVRSGSIVVPIALHALGNLFALSLQVASWYLL